MVALLLLQKMEHDGFFLLHPPLPEHIKQEHQQQDTAKHIEQVDANRLGLHRDSPEAEIVNQCGGKNGESQKAGVFQINSAAVRQLFL